MAIKLNPALRTPTEVAASLQISPSTINPYFFVNIQKELSKESIFSGAFSMDLSTVYSVARKATLIALAIVGTGIILTTAFFAPHLLFPMIVGVGLTFYKLVPLILAPMERLEHQHKLRKKNLEKANQIENQLHNLSFKALKTTYLSPLKIPSKIILQGKTLKDEDLKLFIIPILAKYLFWKESIKETQDACKALNDELKKVKTALSQDDDKTLPLKKPQRKQLEHQALSIQYRLFDMEEADLPLIRSNGLMPSALKAAYLLHIMQNPTEMKDFSDYGTVVQRPKYERDLEDIPSMKRYFVTKGDEKKVDRAFLMANLERIGRIEKEVFAA